ncbi:uncharacterized protein LOC143875868 [Tasmannia lanceolata]|uniref:uncharacterized protein LOC143875868 n=1 Tax=Tasmannia lanceolata TaxID=3420 RepID=UPI004064B938
MASVSSRMLSSSKSLNFDLCSSSSSPAINKCMFSRYNPVRTLAIVAESRVSSGNGERKKVIVKASVSKSVVGEVDTKRGVDLSSLVLGWVDGALKIFRPAVIRSRPWQFQAEMFIERGIISCRFFTLIAVAGSLIGSILCFVEGCFLVLESFFQYFHSISERSDHGEVMQLLIEALDIFLVGTAMLVFGIGLYFQFVASKHMKRDKGWLLPQSNFFGLFPLKKLPSWVETQTVSQAKSKIGNAVVMLLQTGIMGKFKTVPLVTGVDLACFAGAILVSSACVFLLSRLSMGDIKGKRWL